jgi:hypothetical protein
MHLGFRLLLNLAWCFLQYGHCTSIVVCCRQTLTFWDVLVYDISDLPCSSDLLLGLLGCKKACLPSVHHFHDNCRGQDRPLKIKNLLLFWVFLSCSKESNWPVCIMMGTSRVRIELEGTALGEWTGIAFLLLWLFSMLWIFFLML